MDKGKYIIERMQMFRKALDLTYTVTPIRSVFDMACNNGYWLNVANRFYPQAKYLGMDTLDFSDRGWKEFTKRNVKFQQGNSLNHLKKNKEKYDMVLSMGVMYYYNDIDDFLDTVMGATKSTVLIDTFVIDSSEESVTVENPRNLMVDAAEEESGFVTIPSENKIIDYLESNKFLCYKVDSFTESYNDSVGKRLDINCKRSAILGIKRRDYSGETKYPRMFKSPI